MSRIRPATTDDVPAIAGYLARAMKGGPPERYARMLGYQWRAPDAGLGALIERADGTLAGFHGALWSQRTYRGALHDVCNLCNWVVDEDARGLSLPLLKALLDQPAGAGRPAPTFVTVSPNPTTAGVMAFLKFASVPSEKVLVPAVPRLGGGRVLRDPSAVRARLDADGQRVFDDHARYRCGQFVLDIDDSRGGPPCHIVTVRRGRGASAFADVLHASRPELLAPHLGALAWAAARVHGVALLGVERRWLGASARRLRLVFEALPLMARGPIPAAALDGLYTELVPMYG